MANKSKSDKHPWWAKIVLIILFIVNLLIGDMVKQIGFLTPPEGFKTIAAFFIFGQVSGLLVAGVIYLFYRSAQAYDNKGNAIDRSHIWVDAKTGNKVNDATVKNVYEKQHGYGSWEKKVEKDKGCLTVFAILAAVAITIWGFYALSFRVALPVLLSAQILLGSNLVYWLTWVGLAALGCFAVFMLYFVFWDLANYNTSLAFSPGGHPLGFQNESPSWTVLLPKFVALALTILLNIAVMIFILFPRLMTAPIGKHYTTVLFLTFMVSGFLWFFGAFMQDVKKTKDYQQQQSLEDKKKALEEAVQLLFGKDTERKERLVSAFVLLGNRDSLSSEGIKGVVDILKTISGKDYGTDYSKWEEWIMKQLMEN